MTPGHSGKSPVMQPGHDRPDHRAHHDGDKQNKDDLVKSEKQPEA